MYNHIKPFWQKIILAVTEGILLVYVFSCSKERKESPLNYEDQRIASMTDLRGNDMTATFSYDAQKRLTRIDYNVDENPSVRFEYTLPTITATYYKGAAPDISREKYVFTLLNGKVENIRMTKPDGNMYDTYLDYDANDRLVEMGVRGISSGGANLFFSMDCYFSYPQPNTQALTLYGALGALATDSMEFVKTYNPQWRYVDFNNIGFDYFGNLSAGLAYRVAGMYHVVMPFPFFLVWPLVDLDNPIPAIVPAFAPLWSLKGEGKARDISDFNHNGWAPVTWDSEFNESYYQYDELGRLAEEGGGRYTFTWQ